MIAGAVWTTPQEGDCPLEMSQADSLSWFSKGLLYRRISCPYPNDQQDISINEVGTGAQSLATLAAIDFSSGAVFDGTVSTTYRFLSDWYR